MLGFLQLDLSAFFLGCTHLPGATACCRQQTGMSTDRNWSFGSARDFESQQQQVDISSNLLVELHETFGNLQKLKALYLSNNGLESLPSTLFKKCVELSTLDIHGTNILMDRLRQAEGWEYFDKRRRLKYQNWISALVVLPNLTKVLMKTDSQTQIHYVKSAAIR